MVSQDKAPYVSVVIPTYNRANYVIEAIESVLAQTYTNYEIIVVDDGSTDNTCEALQPYMPHTHYIFQENAGASAARNRGITQAKGEWIAFLDSDDVWLPEKLAVQIEEVSKHPQLCLHTTNATIYRERIGKGVSIFDFTGFSKALSHISSIMERPLIYQVKYGIAWPQCALIRRKTIYDAGLLDTRLKLWQDVDLLFRVALHGSWAVNSRELVRILRRHETTTNMSHQVTDDSVNCYKELMYVYTKMEGSDSLSKKERNVIVSKLSRSWSALGVEQLRVGQKNDARHSLQQALATKRSTKTLLKYLVSLLPGGVPLLVIEAWRTIKESLICPGRIV